MRKFSFRIFAVILLNIGLFPDVSGQPSLSFDLKKPQKFENKKLGSEKTGEKKFTLPRHFIQNTVTHYNWYFNANNKLNEIIDRAKYGYKDDYTKLLSFYNYTLENTAASKSDLDSILYKTNAGILIHDLRNDWIDNLYMLMGKAYFFKKELDSAYLTFQYVNYAFAPKEKDGYDIPIGSNASEGKTAFSIATQEKRNVVKKIFTSPPSRNESLIWQIRTYLEKDELPEAAGLIETLKSDPHFPERLKTDLHEMQALWFYKQEMDDSAAFHLELALDNAGNKQELSRWEFLIGQLYENSGKPELAVQFYERAVRHTLDPILDVYARLNSIRQNKADSNAIKQNIAALIKMARKDRYSKYRDIIYYTAAQIELERDNIPGAKILLLKSTASASNNLGSDQRAKSFMLLGDLSFREKNYTDAKRFYDSVNLSDPGITDPSALEKRKNILAVIVEQSDILKRQDSLLKLAALPAPQRETLLRKMVKQIRKAQGNKEEETGSGGSVSIPLINKKDVPSDLFESNAKGEWYFYNPSLKSKGFTAFKAKWGNRPNVDNWRRMSEVNQSNATSNGNQTTGDVNEITGGNSSEAIYQSLLKNIPLEPAQIAASNDSIENAMVELGKIYVNGLEDYSLAIPVLETFIEKFQYSNRRAEAIFLLYYCYKKSGNDAKAEEIKKELVQKFPGSKYEEMVNNSINPGKSDSAKSEMTKRYESIYGLFIEGKFAQALEEKKISDSLFGANYWTPQLLYIESIYYLRQRQDEEAKKVLQHIIELYPNSPLFAKAQTMIEVLGRRKEIENYLTNLQISRPTDDSLNQENNQVITQPAIKTEQKPAIVQPTVNKKDSSQRLVITPGKVSFSYSPDAPHFVVIVLNNVDPVYVTESRNAFNRYNQQKYYNKKIEISNQSLNDTSKLVLMNGFENAAVAMEYLEKTRQVASTQIVPWLPAGKYSFIIITAENIEIIKNRQALGEYIKFLRQTFPGKF